jgi:hypothetical protein
VRHNALAGIGKAAAARAAWLAVGAVAQLHAGGTAAIHNRNDAALVVGVPPGALARMGQIKNIALVIVIAVISPVPLPSLWAMISANQQS